MEHSKLITLLHSITFLNCDVAGRHFGHTDKNATHKANIRRISFDENNRSSCHCSKVCLRNSLVAFINLARVWITQSFEQRLSIVSTILNVGLDDAPADRRVPPVVTEGAQEGLVDGTTEELRRQLVLRQHVDHRVRLALDPELVAGIDALGSAVRQRFACADDDVVVFRPRDGPHAFLELAREERVPRLEAIVLRTWIALEDLLELEVRTAGGVGGLGQLADASLAEPAARVISKCRCGRGRFQECSPCVEDFLEHGVDLGIDEAGIAAGRTHRPIEHWVQVSAVVASGTRLNEDFTYQH